MKYYSNRKYMDKLIERWYSSKAQLFLDPQPDPAPGFPRSTKQGAATALETRCKNRVTFSSSTQQNIQSNSKQKVTCVIAGLKASGTSCFSRPNQKRPLSSPVSSKSGQLSSIDTTTRSIAGLINPLG